MLGRIGFIYPVVEGVLFLVLISLIIYTFEEGVVGWDGEGENILDFWKLLADGILVVCLFLFSVHALVAISKTNFSLMTYGKIGGDSFVLIPHGEFQVITFVLCFNAIFLPILQTVVGCSFSCSRYFCLRSIPAFYLNHLSRFSIASFFAYFLIEIIIMRRKGYRTQVGIRWLDCNLVQFFAQEDGFYVIDAILYGIIDRRSCLWGFVDFEFLKVVAIIWSGRKGYYITHLITVSDIVM